MNILIDEMKIRPKILHVITDLDVGGSEIHLARLLPYLANDFDNYVCCAIGRGEIAYLLKQADIPIFYLDISSRWDPRGIMELKKIIQQIKPQVIVTNLIYADFIGRIAAYLVKRCVVISNQRSSLYRKEYLYWFTRISNIMVDHYVVQTSNAKIKLARKIKCNPTKITVIPNLIIRQKPSASIKKIREKIGVTQDAIIFICVSNLRAGKGHDTLLAAFSKICRQSPRSRLVLVGDGPLHSILLRQAHKIIPGGLVHFMGTRGDVMDLLAASNIFVQPSIAEGMSNALLEAMSMELPVIATNISANRSIINHSQNGLLFNSNDPTDLSDKMFTLLKNRSLCLRLGRAAANRTGSFHKPDLIAGQWKRLLNNFINYAR